MDEGELRRVDEAKVNIVIVGKMRSWKLFQFLYLFNNTVLFSTVRKPLNG